MPGSGKIFKSGEEKSFPTSIPLAAQPFEICQKLFFLLWHCTLTSQVHINDIIKCTVTFPTMSEVLMLLLQFVSYGQKSDLEETIVIFPSKG